MASALLDTALSSIGGCPSELCLKTGTSGSVPVVISRTESCLFLMFKVQPEPKDHQHPKLTFGFVSDDIMFLLMVEY